MKLDQVKQILTRIDFKVFNQKFLLIAKLDDKYGNRTYIQAIYGADCVRTGKHQYWKGAKYYLSEFMTTDEIVKTAYKACKQAVEHEIMEGFKVDETTLFNPHVDFEVLLQISDQEVKRVDKREENQAND